MVEKGPADLDLLVPAVHLSLQHVDDLRLPVQNLFLLMQLLLQSLQQLGGNRKLEGVSKRFIGR